MIGLFVMVVSAAGAEAEPAEPVLTLAEALEIAASQPQARIDAATTRAAAARAVEARAALLPQVRLGASGLVSTQSSVGGGAGWTVDPTLGTSWDADLFASEVVWDGAAWAGVRGGRADAEAEALSARASLVALRQVVRVEFFSARAAREAEAVARQAVVVQERHLAAVEAYIEVGTRPPIDRAQARADLANARVQLLTAENASLLARLRVAQSIGRLDGGVREVSDDDLPAGPGEGGPLDGLVESALRARPDVRALQARLDSSRAAVEGDRAARLPTLGASASVVLNDAGVGTSASGASVPAASVTTIGALNLGWTIYGGGAVAARVAQAEATLEAAAARVDLLRLAVRVAVAQAEADVRTAKAVVGAAAEALLAARERLGLAEGRYQTGVGSATELEGAQLAYAQAGLQAVQARYSLSTARADWLAAMGLE